MPLDKYLSLHLLLFRMTMIEDLLDNVSLKAPDPFDDEDSDDDDDFIIMDWSTVEDTVGPFKWDEPAPGAVGPSAPVSLASIPISSFRVEVQPPTEHSAPVDMEAEQNEALINASPQKDGATAPIKCSANWSRRKRLPAKKLSAAFPAKKHSAAFTACKKWCSCCSRGKH